MSIEKRQAPRKILRTPIKVLIEKVAVYEGRTVDISLTGVCAVIRGKSFPAGQQCWIRFDVMIESKPHQISALCKVVYSICNHEGFKTGFQFIKMDDIHSKMIYVFITSYFPLQTRS